MSKNTFKKYLIDSGQQTEDYFICRKDSLIDFFPYCRKELGHKGVTGPVLPKL
jgi:hypothetical protein